MIETAIEAAQEAGKLLRRNFGTALTVNEAIHHDIKLEIDEQAQQLITRVILAEYADHCILGEEGTTGNPQAEVRWVVDPLDGTVNYFYNIPHYAVSIAAQQRVGPDQWQTVAGVVFDPELDELFAASGNEAATLNDRPISVSHRTALGEAVVVMGFFKNQETIRQGLVDFQHLIARARKMRLTGSAALDVVYVACGRFDAYIEYGIRLWDIAAGQLILKNAGGAADVRPRPEPNGFDARMWNGKLSPAELTAGGRL